MGEPADDKLPTVLHGVTIAQHLNQQLPLDSTFVDETGKSVHLGQYFTGQRPVVLQLGYYGCPMLCSLISQGTVNALKSISFTAGKDYEFVFVSIDPSEEPSLAMQKKQSYLKEYGWDSGNGWHFLTGQQDNIAKLAKVVGFNYRWIGAAGQFAHPACIMICMPDGKLSRYLYGVRFSPTTMRESMVEASNGKIGNTLDQAFLTCFQYDGHQGKYAFAAIGIMRAGGVIMMILVAVYIIRLLKREQKLKAQEEADAQQ